MEVNKKMSNEIAEKWLCAKKKLKAAQEELLQIEQEALTTLAVRQTDYGTYTTGDLAIRCSETRKWDQAYITELQLDFDPELWPFRVEWKEDKAGLEHLEGHYPDLYDLIMEGLVTKPAKPSFTHKALKTK